MIDRHDAAEDEFWKTPSTEMITDALTRPDIQFGFNMTFDYASFYDYVLEQTPRRAQLVEVGCYVGESLSHLAVGAYLKDRSIRVLGVDWGLGIPVHIGSESRATGMTANTIVANMRKTNIPGSVPVLMWDSALAAQFFRSRSCFMAFIDADHNVDSVRRDIAAWAPKIQRGGILCGHDYDLSPVRRAVNEAFGPCADSPSNIWAVRRTWIGWRPLNR